MIKSLIDLCCITSVDYENQKVRFQIRGNKVEIFGNKNFRQIYNQGKLFVSFISYRSINIICNKLSKLRPS